MSIESEINRIRTNVGETLNAIEEMGGTVPANATSNDMAVAARTIPVGAKIDDITSSTNTTYSSSKIDALLNEQKEANETQDNRIKKLEQSAPSGASGLTVAQVNALNGMFKVVAYTKPDVSVEYQAFKTAFGIEDDSEDGGETDVTLSSISASYSGGDVAVGTALTALTGITVTATYSDGSTRTVTGYALRGEIAEGDNTITVTFGGLTTTFTVTGVVEETEPLYEAGYINNAGELVALDGAYVSTKYDDAWGVVRVKIPAAYVSGVNQLRIAEYDADKNFIKRTPGTSFTNGSAYFTNAFTTEFMRVGFQGSLAESVIYDLFAGYTVECMGFWTGYINGASSLKNAGAYRQSRGYKAATGSITVSVGSDYVSKVNGFRIVQYDADKNYINYLSLDNVTTGSGTFALHESCAFVRVAVGVTGTDYETDKLIVESISVV